jgi:hypothetical protein
MNEQDRKIAEKIWPQHMRTLHAKIEAKRVHARRQLGDRWLLAKPVNRPHSVR